MFRCFTLLTATMLVFLLPATGVAQDLFGEPGKADLVIFARGTGRIVTVDPDLGDVEALAIRNGRILAAGNRDGMKAKMDDRTRVLYVENEQLAIPGFIEGHGHFVGLGESKMNLDLMNVRSWHEVIDMAAAAVQAAKPGDWIIGRGWHQEKWDSVPPGAVEGFPTHDRLSDVSPDNPVLLTHASGHASFANRKAMDMSGVSGSTADPEGGEILRDTNGQPTGIFVERASGLIAGPPPTTRRDRMARLDRAIDLATAECLENGVTSFQDAGTTFPVLDQLLERAQTRTLGVRLWMMIREPTERLRVNLPQYRYRRVNANMFTIGGLKRSIDGALGSRGAWLLEPYSDSPDSTGLATATVEDVTAVGRLAYEYRLQLCVHAIGDRANREVLDIVERLTEAYPQVEARRWRIEHAQHLHPDDIPRFAELGVIASMQGVHCTSDAPWVEPRLGAARASEGAYVWRSLLDSGAIVTNGTDAPVEDVDPLASFHSTVTRRTADGSVFYPEQRLNRMEALETYTINAAYAAFEDDIKGSLKPGKLADIVILSKDILQVPEEEILQTKVVRTILAGNVVYESK
jgi:predicted amidohydrolase YtcJ